MKITDLATGQVRIAPPAEYDNDFSRQNVFPTAEEYGAYKSLRNAAAAANREANKANRNYEQTTDQIKTATDKFSQKMYDFAIPTEKIAKKHNLPTEAVAELRVSFEESADMRDRRQDAMSDENMARRAAKTAQKDLERAEKEYKQQVKDLTAELKEKEAAFKNNANRVRSIATDMDKAYSTGGIENVMKKVTEKDPYIIDTEAGEVHMNGENLREAVDNVINDVRARIDLNNPEPARRIEP